MTSPLNIPLNLIYDNPYQAREHYSDIQTLADSIRNVGLLHSPIGRMVDVNGRLITDVGDIIDYDVFDQGGRVQIAFGHRRLRAFRVLNETGNLLWHSMPVVIMSLTDADMLNVLWSENQQRADFNPIEQAELMLAKLNQVRALGGTQQTVADEWGLDRSTVANKIRLLRLPPDVQAKVRTGKISERQATALLPLNGNEDALSALNEFTSDAIREHVRQRRVDVFTPQPGGVRSPLSPDDTPPMIVHSKVNHTDSAVWPLIVKAARRTCNRCIKRLGPPLPLVCRECPGVEMVRHLSRVDGA